MPYEAYAPSPLNILRQAVKAVPAIKYALAVAGIVSAIAIIKGFNLGFRVAVFGTVTMLVLMTILVVFARLSASTTNTFKVPIIVFLWFSLLLTIATATLLFTSVFLTWPVNLQSWLFGSSKPVEVQTAGSGAGDSKDQDHETVCIYAPAALADYKFILRYVREGPGGWTQGSPLYKIDLPFEDSGAINQDLTRTKCQTITFTRHYGVQFKPYISLKGMPLSFEQVSKLLQATGFDKKYITRDSIPQEQNVWFLLPQYQKILDKGNALPGGKDIYNNFIAR